jgi:hypothetical protein
MADSYLEDYTKYRTTASGWDTNLYDINDKIGKSDYIKVKTIVDFAVEPGGTVSGTDGTILV